MTFGTTSARGYEAEYLEIAKQKIEFMMVPAENLVRIVKQEKILVDVPGQQALDFGCGEGRHTEFLQQMGYSVLATDVTQGALQATELRMKKNPVKTALLSLEGARIPLENNSTEMIVGWEVLHWLGKKDLFVHYMKEFNRILKPKKGHLIFTMPKENHYLKIEALEIGESQYQCNANDRSSFVMYAPNLVTLKSILKSSGFTLKRVKAFSHSDDQLEGRDLDHPFSMYAFYCQKE